MSNCARNSQAGGLEGRGAPTNLAMVCGIPLSPAWGLNVRFDIHMGSFATVSPVQTGRQWICLSRDTHREVGEEFEREKFAISRLSTGSLIRGFLPWQVYIGRSTIRGRTCTLRLTMSSNQQGRSM